MSDTEERKSMDDVLASIRRIVRAEKDPEAAQDAVEVQADAAEVVASTVGVAESAPLALTPDMRVEDEMAPEAEMDAHEPAQTPVSAEVGEPEIAAAAPALDPEMIREMVREVVMEQLAGDDADQLIRGVIRDELVTGDVGANISKNVMRLIQSEISSAMGKQS